MKLRNKIIAPITLLITALIAVAGYILYTFQHNQLREDYFQELNNDVSTRTAHIETTLRLIRGHVTDFATDGLVMQCMGDTSCKKETLREHLLETKIKTVENFLEISLLGPQGNILLSTNAKSEGNNFSGAEEFIRAREGYYLKDVHRSNDFQNPILIASAPILSGEELLGVLSVKIDQHILYKNIFENISEDSRDIYLINSDLLMLTKSRFQENTVLQEKVNTNLSQACFQEKDKRNMSPLSFVNHRENMSLGTYSYIPEMNWCVLGEMNEDVIQKAVEKNLFLLLGGGFFLLFLLFKVISWISYKITQPLKDLQLGVKVMEKGNLKYQVATDAKDEVGQLSRAFDTMVQVVRDAGIEIEREVARQTEEIREKNIRLAETLEIVRKEKEVSQKLAEDLKKFRLAADASSDVTLITDADGIILYANNAVAEHLGLTPEEMMKKKAGSPELGGGMMGEEFYEDFWKRIKEDRLPYSGQMKYQKKSGEEIILESFVAPILGEQNEVRFFVAIQRDITKMLEADRLKTEFVSLASHELRTPLTAVLGYAEIFSEGRFGELDEKQQEVVQKILRNTSNLIEMINGMLELTRLESNTEEVPLSDIDILPILEKEEEIFRSEFEQKGIHFSIELGSMLPSSQEKNISVVGNEKLLQMILSHLLRNALVFTKSEGNVQIEIGVSPEDKNHLVVAVKDTGCGIPRDKFETIFQKFTQVKDVLHRDYNGSGIGLAIVKAAVEKQGGKIWLDSEIDKGSTFYFTVPLR